MNILKEFAKIFIKSKLDDEKRKLKEKLQKQKTVGLLFS